MARTDLWRYYSAEQCGEIVISLRLVGVENWPPKETVGCLCTLGNYTEKHYQGVNIPKGSGGFRILLMPDPFLKNVQRNLLHHMLDGFTMSDSATAYRKEVSMAANAGEHQDRKIIMKMDIESFFGNTIFPVVLHHAFSTAYFPPAVGVAPVSLCCYHDRLPQGAPMSSAISNLVMKPFDEHMEAQCGERETVCNRYHDDTIFLGIFDDSEVKGGVYGFPRFMGFEPNLGKARILTRGTRQVATGLVVNEQARILAPYRRCLRQEIYHCMKYGVKEYLMRTGKQVYLNDGDGRTRRYLESLLGRAAYVLLASGDRDIWSREIQVRLRGMLGQNMCLQPLSA